MNKKRTSASKAGDVSLGGEFPCIVSVSGRCALTGEGIWDRQEIVVGRWRYFAVPLSSVSDFIDTADSYGPNVSEETDLPRRCFLIRLGSVIATKGGWNRPGPQSMDS